MRESTCKLLSQELGHIDLFAMSVGIGRPNFLHRHTEVCAFRKYYSGVILRIVSILGNQTGKSIDISRQLRNQDAIGSGDVGSFKGSKTRMTTEHTEKDSLTV